MAKGRRQWLCSEGVTGGGVAKGRAQWMMSVDMIDGGRSQWVLFVGVTRGRGERGWAANGCAQGAWPMVVLSGRYGGGVAKGRSRWLLSVGAIGGVANAGPAPRCAAPLNTSRRR